MWSLYTLLLLLLATSRRAYSNFMGCPTLPPSRTCTCAMKTRGLDFTCDSASQEDFRQSVYAVASTRQLVSYLKLRNVKLGYFPGDILGDLRVAHFFALNCSIEFVDKNAFLGMAGDIESLDLGQNRLDRVPTEAVENLAKLALLNLNYNRIESIQSEAFRGLISLLRLTLFGNKIKVIDERAFVGIGGNLTQVNLGDNRLKRVPSKSLRNLTGLQKLHLQENQISKISQDDDEFMGFGDSLDMLELTGNQIEELDERAFRNLKAINSLDLDNNLIKHIHPKAFVGVEDTLEWLKLAGNRLKEIPAESLGRLRKLRQLDLRQNLITKIDEDDFKHYGKTLKFLYLQKNKLVHIEVHAFRNLDSLEWLYLQSNQLTHAPYETFTPVLDTLQILDLHENPFVCDCSIAWFRDLVKRDAKSNVVNMPRDTRCHAPPSLKGLPLAPLTELECVTSSAPPLSIASAVICIVLVLFTT